MAVSTSRDAERALWTVGGVHDLAVIGLDRSDGDQWMAAGATASLESDKRPRRLTRLPSLSKTAAGKTDLDGLREMSRSQVREG